MKTFSVQRLSSQSATLGHLANPADVEKAALDHPDDVHHLPLGSSTAAAKGSARRFFDPTPATSPGTTC
jgi:hypothetical protein